MKVMRGAGSQVKAIGEQRSQMKVMRKAGTTGEDHEGSRGHR